MTNIWEEVLDGNIAGIRSLLEDGVVVDERNWLGETPLLIAARYGLEDMATVRKGKGGWPSCVRPFVEYSDGLPCYVLTIVSSWLEAGLIRSPC